jgi:hypothetical protein
MDCCGERNRAALLNAALTPTKNDGKIALAVETNEVDCSA